MYLVRIHSLSSFPRKRESMAQRSPPVNGISPLRGLSGIIAVSLLR